MEIRPHVVRFMIFYTNFVDRFGQILLWLIATLVQHERIEKINTIFWALYGHLNGFMGFCHYPNVGVNSPS